MTDRPPYDGLLARLEKERAHHESCAALSRTDEGRIAHSGMASGFHIAAVHLVEETEGPGAAREYMERTTDEAGTAPVAPFDRAAEREQYEAQVHKALRDYGEGDEDPGTGSDYGDQTAVVMRVRDVEVERLRAERDQLAGQVDQLIDRLGQYADRGIANGVRAEQAEATIARVRAFAEDMRTWCSPHGIAADYADRLEAVLGGRAVEQPTGEAS